MADQSTTRRRLLATDTSWMTSAACRNTDVDFFPLSETGAAAARAKAICRDHCPVRAACLEYALHRLDCGIAGGLTTEERRAFRRGQLTAAGAR